MSSTSIEMSLTFAAHVFSTSLRAPFLSASFKKAFMVSDTSLISSISLPTSPNRDTSFSKDDTTYFAYQEVYCSWTHLLRFWYFALYTIWQQIWISCRNEDVKLLAGRLVLLWSIPISDNSLFSFKYTTHMIEVCPNRPTIFIQGIKQKDLYEFTWNIENHLPLFVSIIQSWGVIIGRHNYCYGRFWSPIPQSDNKHSTPKETHKETRTQEHKFKMVQQNFCLHPLDKAENSFSLYL